MEVAKGYSIAYEGLKNGPHDFEFNVDGKLFEAFDCTEIRGGDCDVKVHMERAETQLALDVAISGSVVVECDRCLEDCTIPIEFEGQLLVKFSREVYEYDGEILWLLPGEGEVDMAQYIYESIVLSLPYQRVHPEGECNPEMLARFNIVNEMEFAAIEARNESQPVGSDWEKLAELKQQMEQQTQEKSGKPAEK